MNLKTALEEQLKSLSRMAEELPEPSSDHFEDEQEERQRLEAIAIELERISKALVPPEILRTDTEHPEFNRQWWEKVKAKWNPDGQDWLWIHSKISGRCKTRVAYLAVREWIRQRLEAGSRVNLSDTNTSLMGATRRTPDVVWIDGDDFSEACRARNQFSLGNEVMAEAHRKVKDAKAAKLLVLDDMTKRKMNTEAVSDGFWEVVKHRHQCDLVTIVTDNISLDELEEALHPKHAGFIVRRLSERCLEADFDSLSESP